MKRVSIIGCCGSGKSTLSRKLNELINLPIVHLDKEFWSEDWTPSDRDDFRERVVSLYAQNEWIIDGHYYSTLDDRLRYSDTVFYLDYPTSLCLFRTFKRMLSGYGRDRDDCAVGCPERFDWEFVQYVCGFRKKFRARTIELLNKHSHLEVYSFTHPKDLQAHLQKIS